MSTSVRTGLLVAATLASVLVAACGPSKEELQAAEAASAASAAAALAASAAAANQVSFATLEDARATARDNAVKNAQNFRTEDPAFKGWEIAARGDSSQTNACPQGDGWATMTFISPDKTQKLPVKCSTVSASLGCLPEAEFKTKVYAAEDGHCQPTNKVPFPLPKLTQ